MTVKHGLSIEEYHADQSAVSKSGLDDIERSPATFYALHLDPHRPPKPAPTPAMMLGTLVHCAVLEPDAFHSRYRIAPDCDRRTANGKAVYANVEKTLEPGQQIISEDDYQRAMRMSESILKIEPLRQAFSSGHPEVSAYWTDEGTGAACRCRPDWAHEAGGGSIIVDLKTCLDASPEGFAKSVANWNYAGQAAYYSDGYAIASGKPVHAFIFAAVEKTYPFLSAAYMLTEEDLEAGRRWYKRQLSVYADCMASGKWPGYSDLIQPLTLPAWARKNEE